MSTRRKERKKLGALVETVSPRATGAGGSHMGRPLRLRGWATRAPIPDVLGVASRKALIRRWLAKLSPFMSHAAAELLWGVFERYDTDGDGCLFREEFEQFACAAAVEAGLPLPSDSEVRNEIYQAMRTPAPDGGLLAVVLMMRAEEVADYLITSRIVRCLPERWRPPQEERWTPGCPVRITLMRLQRLREGGREEELRAMLEEEVEWTFMLKPVVRGRRKVAAALVAEMEDGKLSKDWHVDAEVEPGGWTRVYQRKDLKDTSLLTHTTTVWLSKAGFVARGKTVRNRDAPSGEHSLGFLMENTFLGDIAFLV
eukprot:Hpha_TRINITY_DN26727_c0_g1::TRINITY_DN26727_c0_g1_i1::g.138835::m.138835